MKKMSRISRLLIALMIPFILPVCAQQPLPDSELRLTLERAVYHWQAGKATDAYLALDSIIATPSSAENAATKVKAALWTANYLTAQKKIPPAKRFLDSAMTWAEQFKTAEELRRTYEVYSEWHLAAGNPKTAMVAREAAWKITDSLQRESFIATIDSMRRLGLAAESENNRLKSEISAMQGVSAESETMKTWTYFLGGLCAVLLILVFLLNGNLQRLRNAPPAPAAQPVSPSARPGVRSSTQPQPDPSPVVAEAGKQSPPAPVSKPAPSTTVSPGRDIAGRLREVELVLINADTLSQHQNGETKAIRNLLNEYMAQLPFIMKTLDEAITKNEASPILLSLEHLRPYIHSFGMQSTNKLIEEIETDAEKEKVSKLLSRVFQVRNHCRRAADEAKALLEKLS
jgi:hypothetical protein